MTLTRNHHWHSFCYLLCCAALLWIPLPGASTRPWAVMGWSSFVFLISIFWVILWFIGKVELRKIPSRTIYFVLGLVLIQLWTLLQLMPLGGWSLDRTATKEQLILGSAYTCFFVLWLQILNNQRLKILLSLIVISALIQSIYGISMVVTGTEKGFFLDKTLFVGMSTGTFVNPNHFAAYLCLGVVTTVAILLASIDQKQKRRSQNVFEMLMSGVLAWRLALILMVIGLVMTSSRMGNLSFLIAIFTGVGLYMLMKKKIIKSWIVLVISIVLIDALVIGKKFGTARIVQAVSNTVVAEEARTDVVFSVAPLVKKHGLLGSGAGSFYSVFPEYRPKGDGSDFYYHAHNDYLEFIIELGVPGVVVLAILTLLVLNACRAAIHRHDSWRQIAGYATFMALVAIAVHSTADFNLRIPAYSATLLTLITCCFFAAYGPREPSSR